jgi:hypothetical protein
MLLYLQYLGLVLDMVVGFKVQRVEEASKYRAIAIILHLEPTHLV